MKATRILGLILAAASFSTVSRGAAPADQNGGRAVLDASKFEYHIKYFNEMGNEPVVNLVPNAEAWSWLKNRIPYFECPDAGVEEMYYFRWWSLRKHLKREGNYYAYTEFLTKPRPISSALGHDLMEDRWFRDQTYDDSYVKYWLRGNKGKPQSFLHKYSSWLANALYRRYLVTGDKNEVVPLLGDLVADYHQWQKEKQLPNGLYWQYDVRDAMEESISGGRHEKNIRPTINSYMFGNAKAIAEIARLAGRDGLAHEFEAKAAKLRELTERSLWNAKAKFFEVREQKGGLSDVREEIGFIPWYFELPEPGKGYEQAWAQLTDPHGFWAPYGITTAERRSPYFRSHGIGDCEWDGAVWPYATSQTLTALANVMCDYGDAPVTKRDYYDAFITYVRSQHYDRKPYIGEYMDETNGQWLKGLNPRSRDYHHSTFADLLITGLVGLRPRSDNVLELHPLLPAGTWNWFCLDGVRYHGHDLTILWDRDGTRYGRGRGLLVLEDGKELVRSATLKPLKVTMK